MNVSEFDDQLPVIYHTWTGHDKIQTPPTGTTHQLLNNTVVLTHLPPRRGEADIPKFHTMILQHINDVQNF